MRVPHVSSAVGRSCAALVCAALVANAPLNTVLEASTFQPASEVQQLRFDVLAAGAQADNQLIFPSELIAAAPAKAAPLTSAQRAERAEKEMAEAKANAPSKNAPAKAAPAKAAPAKKAAAPAKAAPAKAAPKAAAAPKSAAGSYENGAALKKTGALTPVKKATPPVARQHGTRKCPPWQCPRSAPAPPHWFPSRPTGHLATASGARASRASRLQRRPCVRL